MPTEKDSVTISVIITAHAESILTHRTLRSVRRALEPLTRTCTSEVILHIDNATSATENYIEANREAELNEVTIYRNHFGDLGSSRNFAIQQANGKYIATIDADDLMSQNWLRDALDYLEAHDELTVAHSEVTVEFEGADSLIIKHGDIDLATDTLLSVYANRWNSVIVAPRKLLLEEPYTPNSPGYGYEDWHLNSRLIARGVRNVLIPNTAIFVRRKKSNSEWARQIQSMAVLRANPLLAFSHVRKVSNPFENQFIITPRSTSHTLRTSDLRTLTKRIIKKNQLSHKIARQIKLGLKRKQIAVEKSTGQPRVPNWLQLEWKELHAIDRQIFPSQHLLNNLPIYDTITHEHKLTGHLYKQLVDTLRFDSYDYLIFVPWLVKGGADQYAINYANTIASEKSSKRVLIISTLPIPSPWRNRLDDAVDFLDFGSITQSAPAEIKHRLMEHLIENAGVTHLHVINSEFGYDFVQLHEKYIKATDKKLAVTSFSQSVDKSGRIYGYSHTHVPFVYDLASMITSDNEAVINMWQNDYGFDSVKMVVHRQPVMVPTNTLTATDRTPLQILWAARVAPEKQPEIIKDIARKLGDVAHIHMYGTIDPESKHAISNLPENVTYHGEFDGFSTLPLENYDALLYTSLFDGMPNTLLEAAQVGLPIVASAVGGIPEFVLHEKTGLLINNIRSADEYTQHILRLTDRDLRIKIATRARKRLQAEFSPEKYRKNIQKMLKELDY